MTLLRNLNFTALLSLLLLIGCSGGKKAAQEPKASNSRPGVSEVVIPVAQQAGVIETTPIQPSEVPDLVRVPGKIALPDNGSWRVGAITSGRVEQVLVSQGDYVRKGQILARMHSHDVHEAKAEYLTALGERSRLQSAEAVAQTNYERTQRLYALKAASLEQTELAHQQWIDAQTARQNSDIAVQRERAHLEESLGIPAAAAEDPKGNGAESIPIRAPASGYVLQKNVTPGTVVEPSTDLFMIGELSRLWLTASVRQEYLGKLHVGQKASITVNGMPELRVDGRLTNVGEEFDPTTHTMRVRIEFENHKNLLRPEMLAQAEIPVGMAKPMLLVPGDAVQQMEGQDVVFVRIAADKFAMRPVHLAPQIGNRIPVLEGLKAGEQVVTRGSFILKSEMLKSTMEGE